MSEVRQEYYGGIGENVLDVAAKMAAIASRDGVTVYCNANGTELTVAPGEQPDIATARWRSDADMKAALFRASPEGRAARARRDAEEAEMQRRHDASMASLPDKFIDHRAAITWMVEYAENASWSFIQNRDFARVIAACEASGYMQNDCTGLLSTDYQDPDKKARYVMGQAIAGMRDVGIHQMVGFFGRQALELFNETAR